MEGPSSNFISTVSNLNGAMNTSNVSGTLTSEDAAGTPTKLTNSAAATPTIESLQKQLEEERSRRARLNESMLLIRQKVAGEVSRLETEVGSLREANGRLTANLEEQTASISLLKEENEVNTALLSQKDEQIAQLGREAEHAIFAKDCMLGDLDELQSQVAEKDEKISELQQQVEEKTSIIDELRLQVAGLEDMCGQLRSKHASSDSDIARFTAALQQKDSMISSLHDKISKYSSENAEMDRLRSALDAAQGTVQSLEAEVAQLRGELQRAHAMLLEERGGEEMRGQLSTLKADFNTLTAEKQQYIDKYEQALRDLDVMKGKLVAAQAEAAKLQRNIASQSELYARSVKEITADRDTLKTQLQQLSNTPTASIAVTSCQDRGQPGGHAAAASNDSLVTGLRQHVDVLRATVQALEAELTATKDEATSTVRSLRQQVASIEAELAATKEEAASSVRSLRQQMASVEEMRQKTFQDVSGHVSQLQAAIAERDSAINKLKLQLTTNQQTRSTSDETALAKLVAHLRRENEVLVGELGMIKRRYEEEVAAHNAAEDDLQKATEYGRVLLTANRDLQRQCQSLKEKDNDASFRTFSSTVADLTSQLDQMRFMLQSHSIPLPTRPADDSVSSVPIPGISSVRGVIHTPYDPPISAAKSSTVDIGKTSQPQHLFRSASFKLVPASDVPGSIPLGHTTIPEFTSKSDARSPMAGLPSPMQPNSAAPSGQAAGDVAAELLRERERRKGVEDEVRALHHALSLLSTTSAQQSVVSTPTLPSLHPRLGDFQPISSMSFTVPSMLK